MNKEEFRQLFLSYYKEGIDPDGEHVEYKFTGSELYAFCQHIADNTPEWIPYDFNKPETRPTEYGKYFVIRMDGKIHLETWNGSGWAYNEKVITHWHKVNPPKQFAS